MTRKLSHLQFLKYCDLTKLEWEKSGDALMSALTDEHPTPEAIIEMSQYKYKTV